MSTTTTTAIAATNSTVIPPAPLERSAALGRYVLPIDIVYLMADYLQFTNEYLNFLNLAQVVHIHYEATRGVLLSAGHPSISMLKRMLQPYNNINNAGFYLDKARFVFQNCLLHPLDAQTVSVKSNALSIMRCTLERSPRDCRFPEEGLFSKLISIRIPSYPYYVYTVTECWMHERNIHECHRIISIENPNESPFPFPIKKPICRPITTLEFFSRRVRTARRSWVVVDPMRHLIEYCFVKTFRYIINQNLRQLAVPFLLCVGLTRNQQVNALWEGPLYNLKTEEYIGTLEINQRIDTFFWGLAYAIEQQNVGIVRDVVHSSIFLSPILSVLSLAEGLIGLLHHTRTLFPSLYAEVANIIRSSPFFQLTQRQRQQLNDISLLSPLGVLEAELTPRIAIPRPLPPPDRKSRCVPF